MSSRRIRIALVGTDSLRGREIKNILERRSWPLKSIDFYDRDVEEEFSKLSEFKGEPKVVHHLDESVLEQADLVLLAGEKDVSRDLDLRDGGFGALAIDLTGAFNEDADIPLVVAGVNDSDLGSRHRGLVANPHPVTIILSHVLHTVHQAFGLIRGVGFVLEPASAFDASGIEELAGQSVAMLNSETLPKTVFRDQLAFNLLCLNEAGDFLDPESLESRLTAEIRRVLSRPDLPLSLSVIQTPVFHTYSVMSFLELGTPTEAGKLQSLFKASPYFRLQTPSRERSTSSVTAAGESTILVGRIKGDAGFANSFWIWTVADNLTRGSANNALEIAQKAFDLQD